MKYALLGLSTFLFLSFSCFANNTQYLIQEMEELRNSLKVEDPTRIDLTLRLADLYFDSSIKEEGGNNKSDEVQLLKQSRSKALELYKQSLNGGDGLKAASGLNKIKIQFQIARLLTRLDEAKMAEPYYLDILNNNESPKKMQEQASLALAEWNEEETRYNEAKKFYDKAISNCSDKNSCNYAYYRLAWLHYKDTKLDDAIAAMEKSLWSDETTIRENSLADFLLFLSNKETNGLNELETIKKISQKANRPELVRLLVEAFYVAGNRLAGSNLLADLNNTEPNLYYEVRLLEEYYGFRKWDKVTNYLSVLEKRKTTDIPKKLEEANEVQTILRRFVVQVDAEMQVLSELDTVLKRSIEVYLNLYPRDELRMKMQSGWLAVEKESSKKLAKLDQWIKEDTLNKVDPKELRKLRQTRLALAQSEKKQQLVIEDSLAIASLLNDSSEALEFNYVAARELYSQKNYTQALPLFTKIVNKVSDPNSIEKWAILSQNLILDIYNVQKNYDGIISQVTHWKSMTAKTSNEEVLKENKSMDQILVQAKFEKAFLQKESRLALDTFYEICMSGEVLEKSCPNAKVLSVKFKDQEKLVNVLEKQADYANLATELELMGRFSQAAMALEKVETKPSLESFVKMAFLFELDQNVSEQNRILNKMVDVFKSEKVMPSDSEKAAYTSLLEAKLINENTLMLPWSTPYKIKVASQLQVLKPSELSKKVLLSQTEGSGAVWSKVVLTQLEADFNKTNAIKFYGVKSQALFKQRTKSIDQFATNAKAMLTNADLETRVYILYFLKMTYKNMANEILNTPIPDGLDDKTLAQVTTQISTMADPFDRVNEDYDRLLNEQLVAIADISLRENVAKNIANQPTNLAQFIVVDPSLMDSSKQSEILVDLTAINIFKQKLLNDPENKEALLGLKDFYARNNKPRVVAYFSERLENLKQVE